jgi:hypothetical protein
MAQKKQQRELIALAVLVVIAGSIWYFHLGGPGTRNSGVSPNNYTQINALDYGRVIIDLSKTQGTEYKSAGRNIFVMTAVPVAKLGPVKEPFVVYSQPQPPAPPPPPELPLVFFGYGMLPAGGARQAFLKEPTGDAPPLIVSEGDVVLNHFRILHIGNDKIEFEDTLTGLKGSKTLEASPAA